MSDQDNLKGIQTKYKNTVFKSMLESKFAYFLDCLNIKWKYEPKTFLLSNGITYRPDFYLTDANMWIEVKGLIEKHNREISKIFVTEIGQHLILISSKNSFYYGNEYENTTYEDSDIYLGRCSKCKKFFFASMCGLYNCKNCMNHNGDHDLIDYIHNTKHCVSRINVNFSDINSIKQGLIEYGINN